MIFWISIQNWVDYHKFQIFSRTFFFVEKCTPGPPQGLAEKKNSRKYLEFVVILSVLDADSEYHISFELEWKIKKLSGDDFPDF